MKTNAQDKLRVYLIKKYGKHADSMICDRAPEDSEWRSLQDLAMAEKRENYEEKHK